MTRYADPNRCPDCGSAIAFQAPSCPRCGLVLRGSVAQRLFETLTAADRLLVELRAASLAPATTAAPTTSVPATSAPPGPAAPGPVVGDVRPPAGPPAPRLTAASVPKILLGLGAACVLVAALVFLAVTWSALGIGGRTAVLVALTAATGALAVWMARRDLRGAAESLSLVSLGLLTLDVFGAENAGWFGDPTGEAFAVLLGSVLALAGVGLSAASGRTPTGTLLGTQVVTALGLGVACFGLAELDAGRTDADLVGAVVVAMLAAEGLRRLRTPVAAVGAAGVAGIGWLTLVAVGLYRADLHPTFAGLWGGLHVWTLLAAAALAGTLALLRALPLASRVGAGAAGTAVLTAALLWPALDEGRTAATLAVLGALVVLGLLAWFTPRPWGLVASLSQAIGLAVVAGVAAELAGHATAALLDAAAATGSPGGRVPVAGVVAAAGGPAPWLLPLALLALVGTLAAAAQASPAVDTVVGLVADLRGLVAVAALTVVLTVTLYAPPVWLPVLMLLVTAVGFQSWWLLRGSPVPLAVAAGFLAAAVVVAQYDAWLTAGALGVVLGCAVQAHLAARQTPVAQLAGAVAAAALAWLTWTVGVLADTNAPVTVLVGLVLLALVGTTTSLTPAAWWRSPSAVEARAGLEAGAAAAAVPLALLGVSLAPAVDQPSWAAGYLTLAGAAVTATSLLRADRRLLGWPGGALLAAASWVRLWDIGVQEPEAYTLPSATALALVGLWHLHQRPGSATMTALGPALGLALVPSLLWALAEPEGLRVLLLGLGCLALVLAGARLRWTAPVVFGAAAGGLLVLRLAAPYIGDTVPRWVLIGAAGALLIATGVTWERRLREARQLRSYVLGLR